MRRADDLSTPRGGRRGFSIHYDPEAFGRFSEAIARYLGTARYLVIQTAVIAVWIAVVADAPQNEAESRENQPAVAAAAERAVDVHARRANREAFDGLLKQDRHMRIGHNENPSSSGGSPSAPKPPPFPTNCSQLSLFHSSNFLPCPTRTTALSSCA